jgi:hypothetical protein
MMNKFAQHVHDACECGKLTSRHEAFSQRFMPSSMGNFLKDYVGHVSGSMREEKISGKLKDA